MRSLWCALAFGVAVSGCDGQQPAWTFADGAVSVRSAEFEQGREPTFSIVVSDPGWLRVGFESADGNLMDIYHAVSSVPRTLQLRVAQEEYDSDRVLEQLVSPLFGAQAVQMLREEAGAGTDHALMLTTLMLEDLAERSTNSIGPAALRVPGPASRQYFRGLAVPGRSDDPQARLATWVYVPRSGRHFAVGVGREQVTIMVDGAPVSVEEAGAVVNHLVVEYSRENIVPGASP